MTKDLLDERPIQYDEPAVNIFAHVLEHVRIPSKPKILALVWYFMREAPAAGYAPGRVRTSSVFVYFAEKERKRNGSRCRGMKAYKYETLGLNPPVPRSKLNLSIRPSPLLQLF